MIATLVTLLLVGAFLAGVRDAIRDPAWRHAMRQFVGVIGGTAGGVIGLAYAMRYETELPVLVLASVAMLLWRHERGNQMQQKGI